MSLTPSRITYIDAADPADSSKTKGAIGVALPIGTYLVAFVASSGGGSTIGLTDSKGNVWTKRQDASNANSPSALCDIFTTADTGLTTALTATDTLTGTSTAGSGCGDILLVKVTPSAGNTVAYNNGSTGTGNTTAPACAAFTPGAGNLVLAGLVESSASLNTNTTPGAGFTKIAGIDAHVRTRAVVAQYRTAASGTTTTPFATSPAQQYAVAAISLREVAPPASSVTEFARGSYNGTATKTLSGTNAIPVLAAVPVGDTAILIWNVPGSSPNTEAGTTVTDTKGNTWLVRELAVQNGIGANSQVFIASTVVTTALTTSDKITPTVDNAGSVVWAYVGLHGTGLTGYDVSEHNNGATNQAFDTGTTAAAAQAIELVIAAWGYTGSTVTVTGLPAGFVALPTQETTSPKIVVLAIAYAFVNATGTRHVTGSPSDSANHPWCGLVASYKSLAPPPPDAPWSRFDGTSWVASEMVA